MKRKSALLLVLFACCVVVGFCTQNFQAANERLSHRAEAQSRDPGSPGLWQAILDGLAASRAPQAEPAGRTASPILPIEPLDSLAWTFPASPARAAVRCPELRPFPQLALLAAHSPQEI